MEINHLQLNMFKVTGEAEFQKLGSEIQKFTGEKKFPLLLFLNFKPQVVAEAFRIAEKRGIRSSKYIWGIAKNLK